MRTHVIKIVNGPASLPWHARNQGAVESIRIVGSYWLLFVFCIFASLIVRPIHLAF